MPHGRCRVDGRGRDDLKQIVLQRRDRAVERADERAQLAEVHDEAGTRGRVLGHVFLGQRDERPYGLELAGLGQEAAKGVAQDVLAAAAHGKLLDGRATALWVAAHGAEVRDQNLDVVLDPGRAQLRQQRRVRLGQADAHVQVGAGLDERLREHSEHVVRAQAAVALDLDAAREARLLGRALAKRGVALGLGRRARLQRGEHGREHGGDGAADVVGGRVEALDGGHEDALELGARERRRGLLSDGLDARSALDAQPRRLVDEQRARGLEHLLDDTVLHGASAADDGLGDGREGELARGEVLRPAEQLGAQAHVLGQLRRKHSREAPRERAEAVQRGVDARDVVEARARVLGRRRGEAQHGLAREHRVEQAARVAALV
eukprot:Unigene11489_Nuclearia_a/m.35026 Unigene11489_Nuclearia_a/g.35026  ORF Unigene11489_Nuclearia_a/g.35026 Unigene11489_Nuclearia_a/m.35026 type:complete len:377 (-) Unigene11489_Nuclearia_a:32-1162(-)